MENQVQENSQAGISVPPTTGPTNGGFHLRLPQSWVGPLTKGLVALLVALGGYVLDSKLEVIQSKIDASNGLWSERFDRQDTSIKEFKTELKEVTIKLNEQNIKIEALEMWRGMMDNYNRDREDWREASGIKKRKRRE